ncbi:MAG: transglycosylase domain-containing protein [Verrucomicrobiales bacterium]
MASKSRRSRRRRSDGGKSGTAGGGRGWRARLRALVLCALALLALSGLALAAFYAYLAGKEDMEALGRMPQRSIVYDRRGEIVGRLHGANRVVIPLEQVSPYFIDALVAREDSRFFRHHGIDYFGVLRAMLRNLKDHSFVQGASTITMQLARNSFYSSEKTLHRKLLEVMVTRRIERSLTKHEILECYVNRIYFGAGLYGIDRAARSYFHKPAADLGIGEAAMLAGIIRAPSRYSPARHYQRALRERDAVLLRMLDESFATAQEVEAAKRARPVVYPVVIEGPEKSYSLDAVRRDLDLFLEQSDVEDGGFAIHTTLDLRVQQSTREALEARLRTLENTPGYAHPPRAGFAARHRGGAAATDYVQGAVVLIDNESGGILAAVGGRDIEHSVFNRALVAKRQIGSAFKPFVYACAFETGQMPGTLIDDSPLRPGELPESPGDWSPRNADGSHQGFQPLEWGLVKSRNTMSVRVGALAGAPKVIEKAALLGLGNEIEPSPQLYIGNLGATLKNLTGAYSVFPNQGILRRPFVIARIEEIGGGALRATPVVETPVFSPGAAWMTSTLLRKVMDSGTGAGARRLGFSAPAGGKTGTTNNYTDAWFLGYSSRLSCGVWVGLDRPVKIVDRGYGGTLALPVWVDVMQRAAGLGYTPGDLLPPGPTTVVELCRVNGLLANSVCSRHGHAYTQELPYDMIPTASCTAHSWNERPGPDSNGLVDRFLSLFK